jgi:mono/diheme cytochrome c family protein
VVDVDPSADPSAARARRSRIASAAVAVLILVGIAGALITQSRPPEELRADPGDAAQVALGREVYAQHCAACHGAELEGHPEWQQMLPTGRMPPPPHDASGHTWHHPDRILFGITKYGMRPPYGPPGYESDMPGFGEVLSDEEILAVLAYIKSTWPPEVQAAQRRIDERSRQAGR